MTNRLIIGFCLLTLVIIAGCNGNRGDKIQFSTAPGGVTWTLQPFVDTSTDAEYLKLEADHTATTDMQQYYAIYNLKYFDGQLPTDTIVECTDNLISSNAQGLTTQSSSKRFVILVDSEECQGDRMYLPTLLHEMVHVKLWGNEVPIHGPAFQAEMHRIMEAGAFDTLW